MSRLNLLPDEIKNEIKLAKKNAVLKQYMYKSIAVFFAAIGLIFTVSFVLYTQKDLVNAQVEIAEKQISEQKDSLAKAQDLNSRLVIINKLKKSSVDWQFVFSEIARVTPNNVQIDSFTSPTANTRAKITGVADTEQSVVALKENMASSQLFSYVDIESIVKGSDPKGKEREMKNFIISYNLNLDKAKK